MLKDVTGIILRLKAEAERIGREDLLPVIDRLRINEAGIIEEYADQAPLYAYVSSEHLILKIERKRLSAEVAKTYRRNFTDDSGKSKKPNESQVTNAIECHDEVIRVKEEEKFLEALADAFKHKMQMLINAGAHLRLEQQSTGMNLSSDERDAVTSVRGARTRQVDTE